MSFSLNNIPNSRGSIFRANLNNVIDEIETDLNTIDGEVTTLNNQVGSNTNSIDTINSEISTLNSEVSANTGSINSINSQVITINGEISTLNSQVSTNTSNITNNNSSITTINSDIATINNEIQSLQNNSSSLAVNVLNTTISLFASGETLATVEKSVTLNIPNSSIVQVFDKKTPTLVPYMTSNTLPSGIAFASAVNYTAWNAFDLNFSSTWLSDQNVPQYIGYIFSSSTVITNVDLVLGTSQSINSAPQNLTIQGSVDTTNGSNGTWVTLTSATGLVWCPNECKTFSFVNTTGYIGYRIYITSIVNVSSKAEIGTIAFGNYIGTSDKSVSSSSNVYSTLRLSDTQLKIIRQSNSNHEVIVKYLA